MAAPLEYRRRVTQWGSGVESAQTRSALLLETGMLLWSFENRTRDAKTQMTRQSSQKITPLSREDQERLEDQRSVIERYLGDESAKEKYQKAAGKLGRIRALPDVSVFKPHQTHELQCLGMVLGDAFVEELEMEWVMVEDDSGRDPAVRFAWDEYHPVSADDDFEARRARRKGRRV
jgi:hypothetical protein